MLSLRLLLYYIHYDYYEGIILIKIIVQYYQDYCPRNRPRAHIERISKQPNEHTNKRSSLNGQYVGAWITYIFYYIYSKYRRDIFLCIGLYIFTYIYIFYIFYMDYLNILSSP